MRLFEPETTAGPSQAADAVAEAAPSGPLRRVMLLVAYDGTGFRGFAAQPGDIPTVGGRLAGALERVAGAPVSLTCAGRTDAGVHAAGQVVHFDVPAGAPGAARLEMAGRRLADSLSHQCGPEVAVLDARQAPSGFDARHSALARSYRYLLLRSASPDPLLRDRAWHVPAELDLAAMRIAADCLLGEHDFSAFCRRPPGQPGSPGGSLVRRVTRLSVTAAVAGDDRLWAIDIEANAFCHQMVRSVTGALVSVGEGRATAASVLENLRSRDRSHGTRLAPPGGLCLMAVNYPEALVPGVVWKAPR
ncbi:MAG: tRNA pseudouridine(38-40) synthase TruA [Acidimicrobiales bacterium]